MRELQLQRTVICRSSFLVRVVTSNCILTWIQVLSYFILQKLDYLKYRGSLIGIKGPTEEELEAGGDWGPKQIFCVVNYCDILDVDSQLIEM